MSVKVEVLGLNMEDSSFVPKGMFEFKSLSDVLQTNGIRMISNFCGVYPEIDFVLKFPSGTINPRHVGQHGWEGPAVANFQSSKGSDVFIAGSAALHYLTGRLALWLGPENYYTNGEILQEKLKERFETLPPWKPKDIDIFYIGCSQSHRMQLTSPLTGENYAICDLVFCTEESYEDVLLKFDLPCCRVGFDFKCDFYVSIQALNAILTGNMYLPKYLSSCEEFVGKLIRSDYLRSETSFKQVWELFNERLKKYGSRGFRVRWEPEREGEELPEWVSGSLAYLSNK